MIEYAPDWEYLMQNTREDADLRREICLTCPTWNSEKCVKWQPRHGRRNPWLGLHGICPECKWTTGRKKSSFNGSRNGQQE